MTDMLTNIVTITVVFVSSYRRVVLIDGLYFPQFRISIHSEDWQYLSGFKGYNDIHQALFQLGL